MWYRGRGRVFADRREAGRELGARLAETYAGRDVLVLGLPRGGVPVAYEVAAALRAPLDVFVVRKLGAPFNPEYAIGAVATGGVTVLHRDALAMLSLTEADVAPTVARERAEVERRERRYRSGRPPVDLRGKTAVLVDDGIATGATMEAAVRAARALSPAAVVVAAPTAAADSVETLRAVADDVVVLSTPEPYVAVGAWYERFPQLSDEEVVELLTLAASE
ncbi:MAG TPA: phosphoribosyltransferase family protein [Gammaproteobacteria bacterium]